MKSTIAKVFLVIGVLVLGLILWALFFGKVAPQAWNTLRGQINTTWQRLTGDDTEIIAEYASSGSTVTSAGETSGGQSPDQITQNSGN